MYLGVLVLALCLSAHANTCEQYACQTAGWVLKADAATIVGSTDADCCEDAAAAAAAGVHAAAAGVHAAATGALAAAAGALEATCSSYACTTAGFGKKDGFMMITSPDESSCCEKVDDPAQDGTCGDPDPNAGGDADYGWICPEGHVARMMVESEECTTVEVCIEKCCELPVTVTMTQYVTSTMTPYDSSSGFSGDSLAPIASGASLAGTDYSGSGKMLGFDTSGSGGLYLPVWLWCLLIGLCCCCCGFLCCHKKAPPKRQLTPKKKSKPAPAPAPPPAAPPAPVAEEKKTKTSGKKKKKQEESSDSSNEDDEETPFVMMTTPVYVPSYVPVVPSSPMRPLSPMASGPPPLMSALSNPLVNPYGMQYPVTTVPAYPTAYSQSQYASSASYPEWYR
jgi:hypothetical protein